MDERKPQHVGGLGQAIAPDKQLGAAHREQLLGAQPNDVEAGPIAVAMANGEIDVLAREVHVVQRGRHAQVDARMLLGKAAQAVDEPLGGKVRRRADGKRAGGLALEQPLGADGNAIEGVAQDREVLAPGLGDDETLPLAIEELDPELRLQRLDLMAHRPLGDEQLLGRPGETFMAGGRLEGLQRIQRRQAAQHQIHLHEKNSGRVEKPCFAGNRCVVLSVCSAAAAQNERCSNGSITHVHSSRTRTRPCGPLTVGGHPLPDIRFGVGCIPEDRRGVDRP